MAHTASKKALRHGGVTVALTVLVVVVIVLLNASVTTLAMRYGWFVNMNPAMLYPVTDTCYDYLDTYVIPNADEDIRIIFCDDEQNVRGDGTLAFVLYTAEELAALVHKFEQSAAKHLVFVIGGSFGMAQSLKKEAAVRLSMSPMTFPHHLARVMVLEQIYRAFKINEGSSYHK